jgi:Ni,Fe-hydrogenase III component G
LFLGSQWIERELREFYNILYIGLTDTRRLLTDYTSLTTDDSYTNYKTTSYNLLTQDIYYN